ncbi:MAG: hypothetical protein OXG13_06775 [Gemmatimonadaceae bacterium]|jgi:hypothetical protein|nr:hypothetical protein [Gemmatimonadaceae bacterium]
MAKSTNSRDDDSTDFGFDPGSQRELEVEDTCCVSGDEVSSSFCRFPDYRRGTMMVMSKGIALQQLRKGTTLETFRKVLVKRHGKRELQDYKS